MVVAPAPGDLVGGVTTTAFKDGSGNFRQIVSSRAGATVEFQGAWDSGTTYTLSQFTTHNNKLLYNTSVSLNDEPGVAVPDPWLVVVDFAALSLVPGDETVDDSKISPTSKIFVISDDTNRLTYPEFSSLVASGDWHLPLRRQWLLASSSRCR